MIYTKQLMRLLADGKPRNVKTICQEMGLAESQVRAALQSLARHGHSTVAPKTYELTPKGLETISKRTEQQEALLERERSKQYLRRQRVKAEEIERTLPVVERALSSRPALQQAWGAMHG